jgi:hypothetical protein
MSIKDRSRDKLHRMVEEEVTKMFESVLDYAQVACPTPDTYKVLRSKILRVGNNCIRTVKKKLDHYDVEYKATAEDIIEVQQP